MESLKRIYCYIYVGGELIQQNDGLWEYVGGRSKGLHICKGISFQEFISRVLQKLGISQDMLKFFYTLKFNPKVLLELEDDDDLDNVVSHSDDFANIYLVESPRMEDVQANIPNTQNASRDVPSIYYSSNASCDAISDPMTLSRGFATRYAENDYVPLKSNQYRDAILGSGHTFKNADEFRNAIYLMSLGGRFQYKYKRNSPKQMSVRCLVEGCPWKITANAVAGNEILRVGSYEVNHNHGAQDECSSKMVVSSKRGASVIKEVLRTNPCYPPRQICKDFVREHGLVLTYSQAWHLIEKAQQYVFGAPRDSYIFLPWFCHRLREINPGTIAQYTSSERHFMQLFIAHSYSIEGFRNGCRPVLVIDSSHLSGPYKGALLSAIAYDADDGMFPLALAVVSSENYDDWYWFLEKLRGVLNGMEVIIISDRHPAILHSVTELFVTENHAYCYRHLKENFTTFYNRQNIRGKKNKEDAWFLLDNLAYARLDVDYNEAFQKLLGFNEELAKWVLENNPNHWVMSKFPKKRWDKMTSNIAESFNAWMREERHQTIFTMLLMHMDKLVAMLDNHISGIGKWKSMVGPKTEEKLMSNIMRARLITGMPYLGGTFRVYTGEVYLVVDMNQRNCTCMAWQMAGLPCPHACAVIRTLRQDVYEYVDTCYKVSTQRLIYSGQFHSLPTHDMPKVNSDGIVMDGKENSYPALLPPQVRRSPGRPRQKRIESQFSKKRVLHCSRCNGIGHNRATCQEPLPYLRLMWW